MRSPARASTVTAKAPISRGGPRRVAARYLVPVLVVLASWVSACSMLGGQAGGTASSASSAPLPIRIASYQDPNLNIWDFQVADALGIYKKHGLDVTLVESVNQNNQLVLGGRADVT